MHDIHFDFDCYHPNLRKGPWAGHRFFAYDQSFEQILSQKDKMKVLYEKKSS